MGWQDRPYSHDSDSGRMSPLAWIVSGSVPLFTLFGIRVRAHASLLIFIILILLFGFGGGTSLESRVQSATMLFAIVLLHEFGHCFAARWVGGTAEDILMTPLGGLAMTGAPRRPLPTFITVAGGPAVNVVICLICGAGLYLTLGFFPLGPFTFGEAFSRVNSGGWLQIAGYLYWLYTMSYALLLFNLLPVWPLDGGQLLQSILWRPLGYYRSMLWAVTIGLVGAGLMIIAGVASMGAIFGGLILTLIGVSCLINCLQLRRMLLAAGQWAFSDEDSPDFSASLRPEKRKTSYRAKWRMKRIRKLERAEATERLVVDQILEKVSKQGMNSLTRAERRQLALATKHQQARDAELAAHRRG
ncbi:MAG TPA: site-2 protease family protein [Tepidisphaeraceae bacterium]|nr:site-2 protease family protein [Tepidisphaeraceae bacterium]